MSDSEDSDIIRAVFVEGNFTHECAPRVGFFYELIRECAQNGEWGVALCRGVHRSGYVKKECLEEIEGMIELGHRLVGKVLERQLFIWYGKQCYWMNIQWSIASSELIPQDIAAIRVEEEEE